jgi:aristolochene synthase
MSLEEGKKYNDALMPVMAGEKLPDHSSPEQSMMHELWEGMRACDRELADDLLEPTFEFMRAQTAPIRLHLTSLGQYLLYREEDVGLKLLCSMQRFSMGVYLTPAQLKSVELIEKNASKHISVVNDIYSFNKELLQNAASKKEGSVLCTAVKVVADECAFHFDAAKRVLWLTCREWELVHQRLEAQRKGEEGFTPELAQYVKGLELLMSGNEVWSATTPRYHNYGP